MKRRHPSLGSEPEDYDSGECSSPDATQISSRKKRRGIIEKRRRDRINNCLSELKRLVPAAFEKQGSAKLEKAEILQMTVDHLKHLHQTRDSKGVSDPVTPYGNTRAFLDYRLMGFKECVTEVARYLISVEGLDAQDPLRTRVISHLDNYLSQREVAINAAIMATTQKTINTIYPNQPIPGILPTQIPQLAGDYLMAQKMINVAPNTRISPFAIPATIAPLTLQTAMFSPVPISLPTPAQLSPSNTDLCKSPPESKSPGTQSPKAPFRPWVDNNDKSP